MAGYNPQPGDPYVTSTVTVEPRSWGVDVDGEAIGAVVPVSSPYAPTYWLALYGLLSKSIGRFDTKEEAVAAVLEYKAPEVCPTCHQVVA